MAELLALLKVVESKPELFDTISLSKIICFVTNAIKLKDDILLTQNARALASVALDHLADEFTEFLESSCGLPTGYVDLCWSLFKDVIWGKGTGLQGDM